MRHTREDRAFQGLLAETQRVLGHSLSGEDLKTLFGVYARSCLPAAERCLQNGRRAMRAALEGLDVRYVDEAELPEWDLGRVLRNVNTPEEYAALETD